MNNSKTETIERLDRLNKAFHEFTIILGSLFKNELIEAIERFAEVLIVYKRGLLEDKLSRFLPTKWAEFISQKWPRKWL